MTREEAIKIFNTVLFFGSCDCPKEEIEESLKMAIEALKTGHWIYSKSVSTGEIIFSECSACGHGESRCAKRMNYCPNCGAKMESEGKEC